LLFILGAGQHHCWAKIVESNMAAEEKIKKATSRGLLGGENAKNFKMHLQTAKRTSCAIR